MRNLNEISNKQNRKFRFAWMLSIMFNKHLTQKEKGYLFFMAIQNLPKIVVALETASMNVLEICSACNGVKTSGDSDVTNPPVDDTTFKTGSTTLANVHAQRQTDKSEALSRLEGELTAKLKLQYEETGRYVQMIANRVAIAHGNVEAGEAVVVRCGYNLKKKKSTHSREFEIIASGPGWVTLRVKSGGRGTAYCWRYGKTPTKGNPPTVFSPIIVTTRCTVTITNLANGSMYAFQFAKVLTSHEDSFSDGEAPQNFSDFIYEGIK